MRGRVLFVFGLVLAGCGDSEDGADPLSADEVAATGSYCCYASGTLTTDSAAGCTSHAKSCVWSETYNDANAAGRGRVCGYLVCH